MWDIYMRMCTLPANKVYGSAYGYKTDGHNFKKMCHNEKSIRVLHSRDERKLARPDVASKCTRKEIQSGKLCHAGKTLEGHHCKFINQRISKNSGQRTGGSCVCRCHMLFKHRYNPYSHGTRLYTGNGKLRLAKGLRSSGKSQAWIKNHQRKAWYNKGHLTTCSSKNTQCDKFNYKCGPNQFELCTH